MGFPLSVPHVAPLDSTIGEWDRRCRVCSHSTLPQSQEQQSQLRNYCRHPNFGRSEQEHKNKGNANKSAKYGLTAFQDHI